MAVVPEEIFVLIAKYADISTLKCLRLSSRSVAFLVSQIFSEKAFPYVNIQISKVGLSKLQDMCNSALISPYIRNIGINTQVPRHTTICEMRRELRKNPSSDPCGVVRESVEALSAALCEYETLCSGGGIVDSLQTAFENLRKNQNTGIILEIWDDGDGRCEGYSKELDILRMVNEMEDPQGILRYSGIFCFDQQNQSRILLALARSGLSLEQLRITPKAHVWTYPWNEICDDLKQQDDITSSFRCDNLSQISIKKIHITVDLDCESWKEVSNFFIQDNSAIHCLIEKSEGLVCLSLEDLYHPQQVDVGQLLCSFPLRPWNHVHLAFLTLRASDLSRFCLASRLPLQNLQLNNVKLITET